MRASRLINKIWTLFVVCAFHGCREQEHLNTTFPKPGVEYTLVEDGTISIAIGDSTLSRSDYLCGIMMEGRPFLIWQSGYEQQFHLYDLESLRMTAALKLIDTFDDKGEVATLTDLPAHVGGMYYVNQDSIFLFQRETLLNISQYGATGNFMGSIPLLKSDTGMFRYIATSSTPIVSPAKNVFSMMNLPPDIPGDSNFFSREYAVETFVNINDLTISQAKIKWPAIYRSGIWGLAHIIPARTLNNQNEFIYSFGLDSCLYLTTHRGRERRAVAKSGMFKHNTQPFKGDFTSENFQKYYIENEIYEDIIYDSYRNIYYRIAASGISPVDAKSGKIALWENKPRSIIILDSALTKIGETPLRPVTRFYPRDIFVAPDGLYISNNHPLNAATSHEHTLNFTRFVIKQVNDK